MNKPLIWKSDVTDLDDISVDTYKFVIDQAKEQLDEIIEESQAITKRGMSILLSYVERIQDKIERMEVSNQRRSAQYRRTLKISLLLIATAIFIIVRAIYT